jgi:hypothetical protein
MYFCGMLRTGLLTLFLLLCLSGLAQPVLLPADSTAYAGPVAPQLPGFDSARNFIVAQSSLNLHEPGIFLIQKEKLVQEKDWLFYYLLTVFLFFGILRISYNRYLNDLFRFFFRTSLRIDQIQEQLVQAGLPSLLYNLFFAVALGLYCYLLAAYFHASLKLDEWMVPLLAALLLALLYLGKYIFLYFSGWLFNARGATHAYAFIVFLMNKVAGIAVLPFLPLLAFGNETLQAVAVTLSLSILMLLFLYRFMRAYQPVQQLMQLSRFHFFMYLLAVEVAPLLLIYKLLARVF